MKETFFDHQRGRSADLPTVWQENHGNLLMGFVVSILVVGAGILAYQQTRFVPPRFPESNSIQDPIDESESTSDAISNESSVIVKVLGAANDMGVMMVAIYDSDKNFNEPEKAIIREPIKIIGGEGSWMIPLSSLPEKFAVAAYHDENNDGSLNQNRFGIPIERYGYSRNARGLTGPPSFDSAVIDRPSGGQPIEIFVR